MSTPLSTLLAPAAAASPTGALQLLPTLRAPSAAASPAATLQNLPVLRAPSAAAAPAGPLLPPSTANVRGYSNAFVPVTLAGWGGGATRWGEEIAEVVLPLDGTSVDAAIKAVLNSASGPMLAISPLLPPGTYFLRYERGAIDFNGATASGWEVVVGGTLYVRAGGSNVAVALGGSAQASQGAVETNFASRWITDITLTQAGFLYLGHADTGNNTDNLAGTSLPTIGIYRTT